MATKNIESLVKEIDLNQCVHVNETHILDENLWYNLYQIRDFPGYDKNLILTKTKRYRENNPAVIAIGKATFNHNSNVLDRDLFDDKLESNGIKQTTDKQWKTIKRAYEHFCQLNFEEILYSGNFQIYKTNLYASISNFGDLRYSIDETYAIIDVSENTEFEKLTDDQYENIELLEDCVTFENSEAIPYSSACQLSTTLEFNQFTDWELRAISHLHNGIFVNKPALAKTKALLEKGLSQTEIADKLEKDPSTVSRQVSQIEDLEHRAEWTVMQ